MASPRFSQIVEQYRIGAFEALCMIFLFGHFLRQFSYSLVHGIHLNLDLTYIWKINYQNIYSVQQCLCIFLYAIVVDITTAEHRFNQQDI